MNRFKQAAILFAAVAMSLSAVFPVVGQAATRVNQLVYTTNAQGKHPVYMVGSDGLYAFPDATTFYSWGYTFSQIVPANSDETALAIVGTIKTEQSGCASPLAACGFTPAASLSGSPRIGQLVSVGRTVYLVGSDGLYGFPDPATFYSWGYKFSDILPANIVESALSRLTMVPVKHTGCNAPLDQIQANCGSSGPVAPRVGQLVSRGKTVYLVGSTGLYGFPDIKTFYSWGYGFDQIVPANQAEAGLSQSGLVPMKKDGCNTPLDQINGTCGSQTNAPVITGLSPTSGPVGTVVTVTGSGFTATGNNINIDGHSVAAVGSSNGTTVSFTLASGVAYGCEHVTAPFPCDPIWQSFNIGDQLTITVSNANGTSNSQIFTVTAASATSINIVAPNGGEQWALGSTQIVTWTASTSVRTVNITITPYISCLYSNPRCMIAQPAPYNLAANVANTGSFSWKITSSDVAGRTIAPSQYLLTVAAADGSVEGSSAAPFNITGIGTPPQNISLTSPLGGEFWAIGSTHNITWSSPASISNVDISLITPNSCVGFIPQQSGSAISVCNSQRASFPIVKNVANSGAYSWTIGSTFYLGSFDMLISDSGASGLSGSSGDFTLVSATAVAPAVSGLSPTSGPVGTVVTVTGSGFTASGNTVKMAQGVTITGVNSTDGKTLTFTVPATYDLPACAKFSGGTCAIASLPLQPGSYNVYVTNSNGASNTVAFTLTTATCQPSQCAAPPVGCSYVGGGACVNGFISCGTLSCNTGAAPTISSLSPTSGQNGALVTVAGTGFTASGNTVKMGGHSVDTVSSTDGKTLSFTVPQTFSTCGTSSGYCTNVEQPVSAADYQITVTNSNGTSNAKTFTVTGDSCPFIADCAAPPQGFYYQPVPGVCGCGTLTPLPVN